MCNRLRLVVWNCAGAFHRKAAAVVALAPDIAILSEVPADCLEFIGNDASGAWIGTNPRVGLAVVGLNGWVIGRVDMPLDEQLFLPANARRGDEQLCLVGVCARKDGDYASPTLRAFSALSSFITKENSIVAGDFNQSAAFDARRSPARHFGHVAELLADLGLSSAWHSYHGESFGRESVASYFHRWKQDRGFHIDYAFVPRAMRVMSAELGEFDKFVSKGLSDHLPLIVELDTGRLARSSRL